ncbi:MAG: response regulator [Mariprofundaceae bacterium]|nr:response regulator [Mariprofundaceae bacterium]
MVRKVLVVDDSPTDRASLEAILNKAGYIVSTADSGVTALEKVKADTPDVIFLDIIMPDMDGYRTCRTLKKDAASKDIPIIFVTSKKEKADKMWAMRQGGDGYIVKPAEEEAVLKELSAF